MDAWTGPPESGSGAAPARACAAETEKTDKRWNARDCTADAGRDQWGLLARALFCARATALLHPDSRSALAIIGRCLIAWEMLEERQADPILATFARDAFAGGWRPEHLHDALKAKGGRDRRP